MVQRIGRAVKATSISRDPWLSTIVNRDIYRVSAASEEGSPEREPFDAARLIAVAESARAFGLATAMSQFAEWECGTRGVAHDKTPVQYPISSTLHETRHMAGLPDVRALLQRCCPCCGVNP